MSTHHRFRRVVSGLSTGGYQVDNSAIFEDGSSEYLLWTPSTAATSNKIQTISFWFKMGNLGLNTRFFNGRNSGGTGAYQLGINSSDQFLFHPIISGSEMTSSIKFRDPHSFYHVVCSINTVPSTESARYAFWVNGVDRSDTLTGSKPAQDATLKSLENGVEQLIGAYKDSSVSNYWDGYLAEFVAVDGQKLDADSFGEFDNNGVWRPIDVLDSLSTNKTLSLVDRTSGTAIGDMTDSTAGNNLAAAFDGVFGGNDGANNATKRGSVSNAFVGKNWGTGVSKTITGFSTRDVNNAGYFDNTGEGRFFLYGSNSNPSSYNDGTLLYSGATFTSAGHTTTQPLDFLDTANFDTSTAYQYHWIALVPTSTASDVRMAELIFYEDGGSFGNNGFYLPFTNATALGTDANGSTSESAVQTNTYNAGSEINDGDSGANPKVAMKFTPSASGTVTKIDLNASSRGFSGVTVRLETDSGSGTAPSGTLVTNGEVTGVSGSGAGMKTATFSTPPSVTAGTVYWIVVPNSGTWGIQHDVHGTGGATGLVQGSTYFSGRGIGHSVYQEGALFTPYNTPVQTSDSPTSNFATLTPIDGSPATFSDGNLKVTSDTSNSYRGGTSSIGLPPGSGKWYCEAKTNGGSLGGNKEYGYGAVTNATTREGGFFPGSYGGGTEHGYYSGSGGIIYNDPNSSVGSVGVYGSGTVDTVALRFDMDTSSPTCKFYVNNTLKHTANLTAGLTYFPHFSIQDSSLAWTVNFGATDFTYTLPTDHKAISAANLYEAFKPAIADGSAHHQSILWSGSSGAKVGTQAGNSGFEPDWAIIKDRNFGNIANVFDAVRGGTSGTLDNKGLAFDSGSEDDNNAGPAFGIATGKGTLTFTGAGDTGDINTSGRTYVGWTWLGGNGNTTPSPQGTRPTTCSVNQTAGFSIVSWEGNNTNEVTIAHGLGATPDMIIYRKREGSQWFVQHAGCTGGVDNGASTKQLIIDGPDAEGGPFSGGYIDTVGSETVRLKRGSSSMNNCNANGDNYIAYMFVGVPGYSAFGKFTGNGSPDGPVIECGFSPSFVMTKKISNSTGGDWFVVDSVRDTHNPADLELSWHRASTEDADQGSDHLDFLSNGFKMRSSGAGSANESNCTTIYMAFGDAFAGPTPATAR